jgi:hypothetical protein
MIEGRMLMALKRSRMAQDEFLDLPFSAGHSFLYGQYSLQYFKVMDSLYRDRSGLGHLIIFILST